MDAQNITVVYKWIAKDGSLDTLGAIYTHVVQAMKENEPGATAAHAYISEEENAVYVRDEFADAQALGFHLQETAAAHFGDLLAIADPGPFFFFGSVPEELKQATRQMGLASEFGEHLAGYER